MYQLKNDFLGRNNLEILSKLLQDESSEKLKILETIVEMIKKQIMADNRDFQVRDSKKFVNNLLEELEHELSK